NPDRGRRERVFLVYQQALRQNPGDPKLERRCADLALELGRYADAGRYLTKLQAEGQKDSRRQPAAAEQAELEDLLGQCERGLNRHQQANDQFKKALELDPHRVDCYDRLARLLRTDLRRIEAAEATIREMVAKNSKAGRAYIYRWRYYQEFGPSADVDADDIPKALKLAPDD